MDAAEHGPCLEPSFSLAPLAPILLKWTRPLAARLQELLDAFASLGDGQAMASADVALDVWHRCCERGFAI